MHVPQHSYIQKLIFMLKTVAWNKDLGSVFSCIPDAQRYCFVVSKL